MSAVVSESNIPFDKPLLEVHDLRRHFLTQAGRVQAVFRIHMGR
jgi:hypothetical protein